MALCGNHHLRDVHGFSVAVYHPLGRPTLVSFISIFPTVQVKVLFIPVSVQPPDLMDTEG